MKTALSFRGPDTPRSASRTTGRRAEESTVGASEDGRGSPRCTCGRAGAGQGWYGGAWRATRRPRVDFSVARRVPERGRFRAALLRNDTSRWTEGPSFRNRGASSAARACPTVLPATSFAPCESVARSLAIAGRGRDGYLRISICTRNQPNAMPASAPAAIADHIRILALQGFRATSFLPPVPGPVRLPRAAGCEWRADPRAWRSRWAPHAPGARRRA
jgi:hypothetical protein